MSQINLIPNDSHRPFGEAWLDSCYQQTLLPSAPWHKLEKKVADELAKRVQKQFNHPDRKEMLFELLGENFVKSYFPLEQPMPQLLEVPLMTSDGYRRLKIEAQSWLLNQAYKVLQDIGYPSVVTGPIEGEVPSEELADFLQHTFSQFFNGIDRELYFLEEDLTTKKKEEMLTNKDKDKEKMTARTVAPSVIKSVSSGSSLSIEKPSTSHIKANLHKLEGDPPPLWGPQSDLIGKSIVQVLQRDPRRLNQVTARLQGRQLPSTLRSYIWADVLFRDQRRRMKGVNVEKLVRERFAKAVQKGVGDLAIKRATSSPITGLIENTVIEMFGRTVGMLPFNDDAHLKEAARVLNVLYVYDRSYEPYLVHWLFPIQLTFRDNNDYKGESLYELAMYLDLLNDSCFPTWPNIFAIAERVMEVLRMEDPEFHDHLREIAFINVQFNPKEFLVQLMHQEKAKAETLLAVSPSIIQSDPVSAKLLADPLIFLRKWIGEGFVGILDTPAILYVWDQCFMQGWSSTVLLNFCLVILELLRSRFMMARDYQDMKQVFFTEPCKLYTMDIQVGFIHLENGNSLTEIPAMNRQRPSTPVAPQRSIPSASSAETLQPCGLKYVNLKLVFPAESFQKKPELSECDVSDLKLSVSVFFGSVRLATQHSSHTPLEVKSDTDSYGERTLYAKFPVDKFEFEGLDLLSFDVEKELGASLYAVIEVNYQPIDKDKEPPPTTLGWSKVPLFQQVSSNQWSLLTGTHKFTLHPGKDRGFIATPVSGLSENDTDLLGYQSELTVVVYDMNEEPFEEPSELITVQQPPQDTRRISPNKKPAPALTTPMMGRTPEATPAKTATPLKTPTSHVSETTPKRQRPKDIIPPPDTPGPVNLDPWVPHRTKTASWNPLPSGPSEAFDLYIDSVRFIPDNASVIKVTGRVLNTGEITIPEDIKVLPKLSSPARSPVFRYKLTINENDEAGSGEMIILLRLYTVDMVTDMLTIIGTCFLQVFETNEDGQSGLRVGGHQLKMRSGMPVRADKTIDPPVPQAADMESLLHIPGCSLLVRLMPHSENFVPLPKYGKGYYQSMDCRPSESEDRVFKSYAEFLAYPKDFRHMIKRVQAVESVPPMSEDSALLEWAESRLDQKTNLPLNIPAGNSDILQCVRYRIKQGLKVKVNQAFGLEGNNYVQCLLHVIPGSLAIDMEPHESGYGKEEQWITLNHDYNSRLKAPRWIDEPQEIHPFYDEHSCVLIQLIGLIVEYTPTKDHSGPGRLTGAEGRRLDSLPRDAVVGWALVPLFRGNAVLMGEHQIPLLAGRPSAEILGDLTQSFPEEVIERHQLNKPEKRLFPGNLSVTIWDNHFDLKDIPVMRTYTSQLAAAGNLDLYAKTQQGGTGRIIANLVNGNMKGFEKTGPMFEKEREFFEQLVMKTYYELVEDALLAAGYGPLKTDHPRLTALRAQDHAPSDNNQSAPQRPVSDSPPAFE